MLVDADHDDCRILKRQLEDVALTAGLSTKSSATHGRFVVLNRIVVREVESWLLGDVDAIRQVYPRVPATLAARQRYREPDTITEADRALERALQRAGYHAAGLPKIAVVREIAPHMDPERNRSRSFAAFRVGLLAMVTALSTTHTHHCLNP